MQLVTRRILLAWLSLTTATVVADDPPRKDDKPAPPDTPVRSRVLEDQPATFVPLRPQTTEEHDREEATRLFAAARALEDRHRLNEALDRLEEALKIEPESPAILGRLSRINLLLGRVDQAVTVAKTLIEVDPGDSRTLALLVNHYLERKNDPASAEALLKKVAENPKLDKSSPGYFLLQRDLGDLYADILNRPDAAADAFAKLMEALDSKAANSLSPLDQLRILEGDGASAYAKFGDTFFKAGRFDDAIRAFRRGLIYKEDHPALPRLLAQALLLSGKPEQALMVLDPYLKRQPAGSEPYELLGEILTAQGKAGDILPRLEAAAAADPKNLRLQFVLVDRLRVDGQVARAEAILNELLKNQAEPQVFAELARSYLKDKKFEELVAILGDAIEKPGGIEAVKPTLDTLSEDEEASALALKAGLAMQKAVPPRLTESGRKVLGFLGGRTKLFDGLVAIDREALKSDPSPSNYRDLVFDLYRAGQYREAGEAIEALFAKHPDEKAGPMLLMLARARYFGGTVEPALEAAREAEALNPNDRETLEFLGFLLGQLGRDDDAIAIYEGLLQRFSTDDDVIKRARQGLSTCYVNKGDQARGEAELDILLRKYPEDAGVNNDLGYLYAEQGKNLEKAEAMIRKALEEESSNSAYLDSLGWVLFKRGKPKEALEPLEEAVEKATEAGTLDVTICEHLGDVLFRLQDYPRARDYWKQAEGIASKSTPPNKRLPEIRKKLEELEKLGPAPKPAAGEGP